MTFFEADQSSDVERESTKIKEMLGRYISKDGLAGLRFNKIKILAKLFEYVGADYIEMTDQDRRDQYNERSKCKRFSETIQQTFSLFRLRNSEFTSFSNTKMSDDVTVCFAGLIKEEFNSTEENSFLKIFQIENYKGDSKSDSLTSETLISIQAFSLFTSLVYRLATLFRVAFLTLALISRRCTSPLTN